MEDRTSLTRSNKKNIITTNLIRALFFPLTALIQLKFPKYDSGLPPLYDLILNSASILELTSGVGLVVSITRFIITPLAFILDMRKSINEAREK